MLSSNSLLQSDLNNQAISLESLLGNFAFKRLGELGLLQLAEQIMERQSIDLGQAHLLFRTSLPVLGKLVELHCHTYQREIVKNPLQVVKPLCYIPLAETLEKTGFVQTKSYFQMLLNEIYQTSELNQPLYITIDRWWGTFDLPTLLELIFELTQNNGTSCFLPLGPSTAEIKKLIKYSGKETVDEVITEEFFLTFTAAGINAIHGGIDFSIHSVLASIGFEVNLSQDLTKGREHALFGIQEQFNKGVLDIQEQRFLNSIAYIRDSILGSGKLCSWSPWISAVLDSGANPVDSPLGLELLSRIALARLFLADVASIVAPIYLMGTRLSSAALFFGANDLGFAAIDSQTADQLGIPRLGDISLSLAVAE